MRAAPPADMVHIVCSFRGLATNVFLDAVGPPTLTDDDDDPGSLCTFTDGSHKRNRLRVRHVLFYEGTPATAHIRENIRVALDFNARSASPAASLSYSLARRDGTLQIWSPVSEAAAGPRDGSASTEPEFRPSMLLDTLRSKDDANKAAVILQESLNIVPDPRLLSDDDD
ncbi:hypothetical protein HK405_013647 [Cladochytrium tenue]|nr:hypothetical protein HK405_013647 [Cladochytrium tenue]